MEAKERSIYGIRIKLLAKKFPKMSEDSMPVSNKGLDDHRSIFIIIFMDTLSLPNGFLPKEGSNSSPSQAKVTKTI